MLQRYWRPILFFLFAAGFLISAPLVVFYTAGYRYHFDSGKVVQTGLLSVSSIPKSAYVVLDGVTTPERTPSVINNITPGAHRVALQKDGYAPWEKTLDVYSSETTFVRDVVLFLQSEPEVLATTPDEPVSEHPGWRSVAGEAFEVENTQTRSVLSRKDATGVASIIAYLPLSTYRFEEAPEPYLLLRDERRDRIVLVETHSSQEPIVLNTDAQEWTWSPKGDVLLYTDGFDIEAYVPGSHTRETITRLSQQIRGLTWYPLGHVAVFSAGDGVYAIELDRRGRRNKTPLLEGVSVEYFWFTDGGTWLVAVGSDGTAVRTRLQH